MSLTIVSRHLRNGGIDASPGIAVGRESSRSMRQPHIEQIAKKSKASWRPPEKQAESCDIRSPSIHPSNRRSP